MRIALLITATVIAVQLNGQSLRVKDTAIVNASGQPVVLRGMGLGGWMLQEPYMLQLGGIAANQQQIRNRIEAVAGETATKTFYNAWLQNHCTKADIDSMAAWGFNSVRLPMHYNLYTLPVEEEPVAGENTWLEQGFQMTDSLLAWCKANRMYLILDLHAAPGGQGNDIAISDRDTLKPSLWQSDLNKQKTVALWKKLAARYAHEEWIGGYDLINEPNWGFENATDKNGCAEQTNAPLRELYLDITKAIRAVDKNHIIFIEGNCWGNNYKGILPLWDDQTVVSFHKYWNYTTDESIKDFLDIRKQYNVPVWMGETGENSNTWFTNAVALFERHNIGWNMWPLKKFGMNNPVQVMPNKGYQEIIDYWRSKGSKPTKEEATAALEQLAEDIKIRNNKINKDVIDAMLRQVRTKENSPFKSHVLNGSLVVYATDFDLGRNGFAYSDKDTGNYWVSTNERTSWNHGGLYRNDGVDITTCSDTLTNGYCVSWIEDGEWMQYTLKNVHAGVYTLQVRAAAKNKAGQMQILVNGLAAGSIAITGKTGWHTSSISNINLPKGTIQLRLLATQGGYDLNYIKLIRNRNSAKAK
ncbi:cellulase family glycosylhydrolase [Aridibaculum aurantiacum]|uniref:cellulase family glycosylhydrolase n=1 Tax=Aridibaculum aurantiacum TaxID=2810307 RepID=UPI001A9735BB|nr:cellulase family glycosylhydrolase [Aridibaculum aurantiacum]